MTTGIYKITNITNNKCYIGCSINIEERWKKHKSERKRPYPIYQSFNKYGIENFTFEIILKCPKEYLEKAEMFCIKSFNSVKEGYNITEGGYGGYGAKHSEEQKKKWSISRKGIRNSIRLDYSSIEKRIVGISNNNNVKLFKSLKDTNLETTSISRACSRWKKGNRSNWSQGYYWMLLEDYDKFGIVKQNNNRNKKSNIEIKLTCVKTNDVLNFKSKKESCEFLKIKHPTFNKNIGKVYKNYLIELVKPN
jgi:group I intron endonuclease